MSAVQRKPRSVYGVTVGVLTLDTAFERVLGDVGHAQTWPFAIQYKVVKNATPERVIDVRDSGLLDEFIAAGQELVQMGVAGLATTCGFLALYQKELVQACGVPVVTSSLLQVPWVAQLLGPGQQVGILTFSKAGLTSAHLKAAGVPEGVPVWGMPAESTFVQAIKHGSAPVCAAQFEREILVQVEAFLQAYPNVGALVLECANMPPYSAAIRQQCGLPVYDAVSLINWFHYGLQPQQFR